MWKCIFTNGTNRGVAGNRDPQDGEFAVDLHPSVCGWFMSYPTRYMWDGAALAEWPGWEEEEAATKNAIMAEEEQRKAVALLQENSYRVSLGLPPIMTANQEMEHREYVGTLQGIVDNPPPDASYQPPLPPGVTPPDYDSLTITVTREPGWNGVIGWRAVLSNHSPSFVPTNLALGVYSGAECSGYKYTTGAFQQDAQTGEWFAICPPGQEQGAAAVEHFGVLYGATNLSCFTLAADRDSVAVYVYEEVA